jgi:YggT family protein
MNGANLTIKALQAFDLLLKIIQWSIILRALLSWFPISKENIFFKILYQITEPVLSPIRKMLEHTSFGRDSMMDFSPVIAVFILWIISSLL